MARARSITLQDTQSGQITAQLSGIKAKDAQRTHVFLSLQLKSSDFLIRVSFEELQINLSSWWKSGIWVSISVLSPSGWTMEDTGASGHRKENQSWRNGRPPAGQGKGVVRAEAPP